jgi:hypothetical protein
VLLSVIKFVKSLKYGVVCVNVCVVHMQIIPDFINVVFFQVVKCLSFLLVLTTAMVSVTIPYVCPVFSTWFEYPELLLFLMA